MLDVSSSSLFTADTDESPAALAAALAVPAAGGHHDELRGTTRAAGATALAPSWERFFGHLGSNGFADLGRRTATLARQLRDNGVTYNVYADAQQPQRPWSLDLFPLIVDAPAWARIEAGVLQRTRVLDAVMADVYGPQRLLAAGLLPPALVQGHPGYLRSLRGYAPVGGTHLHIAAFDLARGPDGHWWVVSQRTQAPSGLGYLLENRLAISRQFPQAFEAMGVQRLAGTYRALVDGLKSMCPAGADAHIALLTPGPYNETYFEHAYLARYLGLTLVEGGDLTVRDRHLYLKTLRGLEPVHGLLKRLDDQFLDPLELRSDSTLGVPGLLQAVRAGNLLVANAPGSAFLESPALLGFLPALGRHLLGEALQLPALPTWWCGERAAREPALGGLATSVIKSTYPASDSHPGFDAVQGHGLSREAQSAWTARIRNDSDAYTLQEFLPLSQLPTWQPTNLLGVAATGHGRIVPRSVVLRVFAVADGPQSWRVLPGGLARIVGAQGELTTMQRGGSSADAWVLAAGAIDQTTLLHSQITPATVRQRVRTVTSRAAEHLFWLGRYTERAENTVRLARLTLEALNGDEAASPPLLHWLADMAQAMGLVDEDTPAPQAARREFEQALIAGLPDREATSVGYNLHAIRRAASAVRERLSVEQWKSIEHAEDEFFRRAGEHAGEGRTSGLYPSVDALRLLDAASSHLAAMTGAQTDRMTRDDGWRLLSVGRHLERLSFLATALAAAFDTGAVHDDGGFGATVALFDSTITFHARYQQSRDLPALLDLLVMDRDNPRSLAWVAQMLRGRLARLAGGTQGAFDVLAMGVPNPDLWDLAQLCTAQDADDGAPRHRALADVLDACSDAAWQVSEDISVRYFSHAVETRRSVM